MSETKLTVQVHVLQPSHIDLEKPKYRLYVDDDLITERTWIWNSQTYIEEEFMVDLTPNLSHSISLEIIKNNPMHLSQFGLQNLRINSWPKPDHGGHRSQLSFIIA